VASSPLLNSDSLGSNPGRVNIDRQYRRRSTGEAASGEQPKGANSEQSKGNMQRSAHHCMEVTGSNRGQRDERLLQGVAVLYWRTGTAVISTVSVARGEFPSCLRFSDPPPPAPSRYGPAGGRAGRPWGRGPASAGPDGEGGAPGTVAGSVVRHRWPLGGRLGPAAAGRGRPRHRQCEQCEAAHWVGQGGAVGRGRPCCARTFYQTAGRAAAGGEKKARPRVGGHARALQRV